MTHPALVGASAEPFWLDAPDRPEPRAALVGDTTCDLVVIGGGYSGLWTALLTKEADPSRDVVLVEAERIGWAASGRNGGFCDASLTHGAINGRERWPTEFDTLERLGLENLDAIEATLARHGIDCHFERTGEIDVALAPHHIDDLREDGGTFLDRREIQELIHSPAYLAGSRRADSVAILNPARLAWGLATAAERLGVRVVEHTPVKRLTFRDGAVQAHTAYGVIAARQAALGTNAFRPLLRRLRHHTAPVYDYALVTEPLNDAQMASIGWDGREGLADVANHFHYYRLTHDNRILWGGYDVAYHFGRAIKPQFDQRPATFDRLAEHFFTTFPQLAGLRFTHQWGGAIDTSTRFCAFYGTAHRGRVAYALGFTGLGVGATRFGAQVMLDLLDGRDTERTRLSMVRTRPLPFPPEPFASIGIHLTNWSLSRADAHSGRRNLWLRTLDRLGLGFEA